MSASNRRHCGYDNCKSIFMMLVVLWHTAQLYILEETLLLKTKSTDVLPPIDINVSWFGRAELDHHSGCTPLMSNLVIRYWLWTEKVAVPGFCFLSGYFGKGFLNRNNPDKDRIRWEKTISTLLVGPLLWQLLTWTIGCLSTRLYTGRWSGDEDHVITLHSYLDVFDNLGTWYLFALLIWRTWTSVFLSRLRHPLPLSLAMALLSAHANRGSGPQNMRMRLFHFFPYYVSGLYVDECTLQRLIAGIGRRLGMTSNTKHPSSSMTVPAGAHADTISRIVGCCGVAVTIIICQLVDRSDLGWMYGIESYEVRPHLIFLLQYLVAGTAVVSVIMLVKTIREPLFPFCHGSSTLAIYEWHWVFANFLAWGNLPFSDITIVMSSGDSFVQYCFSHLPPLLAALVVHIVCYLICVVLGNRLVWDALLRYVCEPNCQWLFQHRDARKVQASTTFASIERNDSSGMRSKGNDSEKTCQLLV